MNSQEFSKSSIDLIDSAIKNLIGHAVIGSINQAVTMIVVTVDSGLLEYSNISVGRTNLSVFFCKSNFF